MAPLNKSVINKKPAKKAATKAELAKKIGLKKTTGAASKKRLAKASKKMPAPAKKIKVVTSKKTPASARASSKAGSGILKKTGQEKTASALKKSTSKSSSVAAKKRELAAKKAKATMAKNKLGAGASSRKTSTAGAVSEKPAAPSGFNLNEFMDQKLGPSAAKQVMLTIFIITIIPFAP